MVPEYFRSGIDTAEPYPTTFGKYRLEERIAAGGMAEVFRATLRGAAGFEKPVALKRILPAHCCDPDFVTLFKDEARIASNLCHANIAQVLDFGCESGSYYLTLELVDGTDLATLVGCTWAAQQSIPETIAAFIVAEAANGLGYAHERTTSDGRPLGIVHRDVSPHNILLSYAGEVKVTDFGIAKAAAKAFRTATGVVLGKLRYMSPEQSAGQPADARSDIFSLGVILHEVIRGRHLGLPTDPFTAAETTGFLAATPELGASHSTELREIARRAVAYQPGARYQTAYDLSRDLTLFVHRAAPSLTREDLAQLVCAIVPRRGRTLRRERETWQLSHEQLEDRDAIRSSRSCHFDDLRARARARARARSGDCPATDQLRVRSRPQLEQGNPACDVTSPALPEEVEPTLVCLPISQSAVDCRVTTELEFKKHSSNRPALVPRTRDSNLSADAFVTNEVAFSSSRQDGAQKNARIVAQQRYRRDKQRTRSPGDEDSSLGSIQRGSPRQIDLPTRTAIAIANSDNAIPFHGPLALPLHTRLNAEHRRTVSDSRPQLLLSLVLGAIIATSIVLTMMRLAR
ncbi:MAG: serine/threonine-protein kinase [Pseudomonadota bacterium]